MPALVTQGMAHRKITACLVLSHDMATCHTPQSFGQMDVPSRAQPCTWRQHGLTGCAQTTSKTELTALVVPAFQAKKPLKPCADMR